MVNRNASTQAELNTALAASSGGDTVTITSWSGTMTIDGYAFASEVEIIGGDNTCGKVTVRDCDNVAVTGLDIAVTVGTTNVEIEGTNDGVRVEGNTLRVPGMDSWTSYTDFAGSSANGVSVQSGASCANLVVRDNDIGGCRNGIELFNSTGALIENNRFETIREDCMKIAGVTGMTIRDNLAPLLRWLFLSGTDHPDFAQFLGDGSGATVTGNICLPLFAAGVQFIFFSDSGTSNNLSISQNVGAVASIRGVSADNGTGTNQDVYNNTLINYGSVGSSPKTTGVLINSGMNERNVIGTQLGGQTGTGANLTLGDGGISAPVADHYYWDQYQWGTAPQTAAGMRGAVTMADLLPKSGKLVDPATYGANSFGAWDTIARYAAGTWGNGSGSTPPASSAGRAGRTAGRALLFGGRRLLF